LKVATWNVNGVRAREAQLVEWIARDRPDVLCLQEIKAAVEQVPVSLREIAGYWSYWHGQRAYSGVSLHIRRELFGAEPAYGHPSFDHETRVVTAQVDRLLIASIYVPNGGKDFDAKIRFLQAMKEYVHESHAGGLELILCGDMNVARTDQDVHPKERNPKVIGQRPDERELLEGIIAEGLIDVSRTLDPDNDALFTWWPPWRSMRQRNIGWRIDYILASASLLSRLSSAQVLADTGTSDHAPVTAEFGTH
jgi:exodeoxyribonuclease III